MVGTTGFGWSVGEVLEFWERMVNYILEARHSSIISCIQEDV